MEDWEIRKAEELWIKLCNNEEARDAFSKEEQKILEEWKLSENGQRIISAWIKKSTKYIHDTFASNNFDNYIIVNRLL